MFIIICILVTLNGRFYYYLIVKQNENKMFGSLSKSKRYLQFKINVRGPSQDITSYVDKYNPGYTFATFNGMVSEDGIYEITVTALDWFGIESDPSSTSVTVLTAVPSIVNGNYFVCQS